jgi:hypothetical protein
MNEIVCKTNWIERRLELIKLFQLFQNRNYRFDVKYFDWLILFKVAPIKKKQRRSSKQMKSKYKINKNFFFNYFFFQTEMFFFKKKFFNP